MYSGEYQLVGSEMSFFTRKLEAQLRFQQVPWRYLFKTEERKAELEARAGTHFIPLLVTPDKWLIHDTIAIGPMLSERYRERAAIPTTPLQRACCFILEDAFNHWLGRACVHSRWCYPDNVSWVGPRFGANLMLDRSINIPFSDAELEQLTTVRKDTLTMRSMGQKISTRPGPFGLPSNLPSRKTTARSYSFKILTQRLRKISPSTTTTISP